MNEKEKIAYHEASHTMLMIHLNMPFEYVSILPEGEYMGHVKVTPKPDTDFTTLVNEVTVLYAGSVGEQIYLQMRHPEKQFPKSYFMNSGRADFREIQKLVQAFFPADQEQQMLFLNFAFHRTEQKVKMLWPQIERLAKALMHQPVITYEELKQVNPILN